MAKTTTADVRFEDHGSIILIRPLTDIGESWIDENISPESWQWFGNALVCEPRYCESIISGMQDSGLVVSLPGCGE